MKIYSILKFTLFMVVLLAVIYPMAILDNNWSPIKEKENNYRKRKSGGYQKIGQKFDKSNYFWGRPSIVDYNAAGRGEAIGPSNPDYLVGKKESFNRASLS
jgi:K+-transporting ATPase ATPase C chain